MPRAAQHRESLVRSAMRLFRRQGYASTGLAQILAESAAPKGSLYHYFPGGKEEIGAAAVRLAGRLMGETLSGLAERHASPRAFAKAYCAVLARWMAESDFRSGCPIATTMLETAPGSPALTRAGREAMDHWIEIVAGVLERDGTPRREARRRARAFIAAIEGALLLSRIHRSKQPLADVATLL